MKKTYIKPENTVVRLNTETMIAQSPALTGTYTGGEVLSREVIQQDIKSQDAWEEW